MIRILSISCVCILLRCPSEIYGFRINTIFRGSWCLLFLVLEMEPRAFVHAKQVLYY